MAQPKPRSVHRGFNGTRVVLPPIGSSGGVTKLEGPNPSSVALGTVASLPGLFVEQVAQTFSYRAAEGGSQL